MQKKFSQLFLILSSLFLFAACSPSVSSMQLYLLPEPQSIALTSSEKTEISHIAVMPVIIPSYLDRYEILLKSPTSATVEIVQNKRWAEDLDSMLQRLVAISLSNELADAQAIAFALSNTFVADYTLSIDISHFEASLNQEASINAYWILKHDGKAVAQAKFISSIPVSHAFDNLLEAQSALIQELTKQVASEYKKFK